jgi:hypothetical protein
MSLTGFTFLLFSFLFSFYLDTARGNLGTRGFLTVKIFSGSIGLGFSYLFLTLFSFYFDTIFILSIDSFFFVLIFFDFLVYIYELRAVDMGALWFD